MMVLLFNSSLGGGGGQIGFYVITTLQTGRLRVLVGPLTDHGGLGFHFNVDYRNSAHDEGKLIITRNKYKNNNSSIK